ncbi:hypothetical protein DID88_003904 [Monilinia fructigena]|uniref:Phosphate transporter n=1 Tax=Monilinia fructigena TaxID=38457 RepID=A0A395IUG0_9HELO|nr:hypothetical protein DID88_003904 [Monilinia fructigena]
MAVLEQFDYIFVIGMLFAFLDAWNIGANDVANSFATSVSSRSLTMKQAMMIASVMEFGGAVGVGARVADTIRGKILSTKAFEAEPSVMMLGMTCALVSSSLYLTLATKLGLPVSTTHSIIGGVIGVGIAAIGTDGINWVGMVYHKTVNHAYCMERRGLCFRYRENLGPGEYVGVIFGTAIGCALLSAIFLIPFLHRKLVLDDWQLRWWHIPQGPLLLRRGEVPPNTSGQEIIQNYYKGHKTRAELEAEGSDNVRAVPSDDVESKPNDDEKHGISSVSPATTDIVSSTHDSAPTPPESPSKPWHDPATLFTKAKTLFFHASTWTWSPSRRNPPS